MAKALLFPLERCVRFEAEDSRRWLEPLASDALYLHTVVFTTQAYVDTLTRGHSILTSSTRVLLHHSAKALGLLRERIDLGDESLQLSEATIAVILALCLHAYQSGQLTVSETHLNGLCRIISLRGGLESFPAQSVKLLMELLR